MSTRSRTSWFVRLVLVILLLNSVLFGVQFVSRASAAAGTVIRVSLADNESQSNGFSDWPVITPDGRYIAFYSYATNLVPGDTNGFSDVFVRDTQTGTTRRVSVSSNGAQSNGDSHDAAISGNGRYVSFISLATNLVPQSDTHNSYDVFVHDLQTGITTAVSLALNDTLGTSGRNAYHQSISADGRYIAFNCSRGNLVAGDTNSKSDIFLWDMQTGILKRISVSSTGAQSNGDSFYTSMSDDGRYVTFHSFASNLVPGDTNGRSDIYVHDVQAGITSRISVTTGGVQSQNGDSLYPHISADGRYVSYQSAARNLIPDDTNGKIDIFLHDRQTGVTTMASVSSEGVLANGNSVKAMVSADGRFITFDSYATNLVDDDTNEVGDVFVRDTVAGTTSRISVTSSGEQALGGESMYPTITSDGRYIVFTSFATNLIANDTNSVADIYLYELNAPPTSTTQTPTASQTSTATPTFTATASNTPTFTQTATSTPTFTATATFTPTATPTNTSLPTATVTPTYTDTPSFPPTATFTATFTATPENTATPAPTATPTDTPVFTPTPTSTHTPSPTATVTPTFTQTATSTPTLTATFTPTESATSTFTATLTPTETSTPTSSAIFPTTLVLDNFNRGNGGIGSNWTGFRVTSFTISSNQLSVSSTGESYIYWRNTPFGVDQEAYFTFSQVYPDQSEQSLLMKLQNNGTGTIKLVYDPGADLVRVITYHSTQGWVQRGADIPVTFENGDRFGAVARADGIVEVYRNGILLDSRDITAWPYHTSSGYIGLGFSNVSGAGVDDFGGGTR